MNSFNRKNISQINRLCKKHKVKALYLFGSAGTPRFTDESDFDFFISFDDIPLLEYADNFLDLKEALEKLFNRKVDLVVDKSIKNPYFKNIIEKTRTLVYECA